MIRRHKLTAFEIQILGLVGAVLLTVSVMSQKLSPTKFVEAKLHASKKTEEAYEAIKKLRIEKGIPIDSINDPMEYGLIGSDYTIATTERGDLDSKLTSVNPNWSAYVIDQLIKSRIKKGDIVAINMTGSFPALNIATIIAVEAYGAIPVWVASEGSSSWGANIPGFTWSVIENHLFSSNIIGSRALAVSLGGGNNTGVGLTEEGRKSLQQEILSKNGNLIDVSPLSASAEKTMDILLKAAQGKKIKIFINIGSGIVSIGTPQVSQILTAGFNSPRILLSMKDLPVEGLVQMFMRKGASVIHLENLNILAEKIRFPIAPGALPSAGTGYIFEHQKYPVIIHIIMLVFFLVVLTSVTYGILSKDKTKKDMV